MNDDQMIAVKTALASAFDTGRFNSALDGELGDDVDFDAVNYGNEIVDRDTIVIEGYDSATEETVYLTLRVVSLVRE